MAEDQARAPFTEVIASVEAYAHSGDESLARTAIRQTAGVDTTEIRAHLSRVADYSLNAAAEFQARGDMANATADSVQAQRYRRVEYLLVREQLRHEIDLQLADSLTAFRLDALLGDGPALANAAQAEALLNTAFGLPHGAQLLEDLARNLAVGESREADIRGIFRLAVTSTERGLCFSATAVPGKQPEFDDLLRSCIARFDRSQLLITMDDLMPHRAGDFLPSAPPEHGVSEQFSPEAPSPARTG
jgi:hypothetical protein